jgi:hypothetical protein
MFVFLFLMIGLRHDVGGDWGSYLRGFEAATGKSFAETFGWTHPANSILQWLAAQSDLGIYLINSVCALLFTSGLLTFCRNQPRAWLALVVAVPYLVTVVAMGYSNQGVAIGLAMFGFVALSKGRALRFVIWVAMAASFHKSALILLPLALLAGSKRPIFTVLWVAVAGFALFALLVYESLDALEYGYIVAQYKSSGAEIRIAMNAMPAAMFLIFRKRFQLSRQECLFWIWMSWGALLLIVLLALTPSSTAVDRVALYWIPLQLFVLSRLPNALGRRDGNNAVLVYSVVTYSAVILFIWLGYADTAFAWLPYQFYPWVSLWR